jgi:geranylgeranyl diphosphate synthase type II
MALSTMNPERSQVITDTTAAMDNALINDFRNSLDQRIAEIKYTEHAPSLHDPIGYIMGLGGKRLRPLLVLLSYRMFCTDWERYIDAAIAVEIFHNFTLMHDDIMDKAPLRRGKETVHIKWNENKALLSGDLMLIEAFRYLSQDVDQKILPSVLNAFIKCSAEVCEGQELDMQFEKRKEVTIAEYIHMIHLKTAALLGFSFELGSMLAKQPTEVQAKLRNLGISLGIGFQLKDDLLDLYADKEKFGKQVGGDIIANKKTILWLMAWNKSNSLQRKELLHWMNVKEFEPNEKVHAIKRIFDELGVKKETEDKINDYFQSGLKQLTSIDSDTVAQQSLLTFIDYLINREH